MLMATAHVLPSVKKAIESGIMATLILTSLVAVLIVPLAFYLLSWRSRKEGGEAGLPPGPRGVPLLGYLPFLGHNLHRCFAELARVHGPIMGLRLGARLCVVLSSPAAAKEALKDYDAVFANHDVPAVALASMYANDLVWAPHGPRWRALRKVSVRELLSPSTIEGLYPLHRREVRRMTEEVRRRAGEPVKVRELAFTAALNVMTTMLWGGATMHEEGGEEAAATALGMVRVELGEVIDAIVQLLTVPNVSDFFPAMAWLDLQGLARQMRRLWARLDRFFDPLIDRRLRTAGCCSNGEAEGSSAANRSRDFLQAMVELLRKGGDPQAPLTIEQVKALLVDMIAGGTDTTSSTVEWTMAQLLRNPQMMTKAKEEIKAVVGKDGTVEESHLPKLHYLEAVVKEVLRLHPVAALVPYCPNSTCTIGGYRIPGGTKVFINVWAIHRDPQFWEDASEFKPERFLTAGHKLDYSGNDFHYLPFGAGRRICPGIPLARRMVMFMLASLLHLADWTVAEGVQLDLSEKFGIVIKKEEPLVAVPMLP